MFSLRLMYIFLSKLWQLFNFLGLCSAKVFFSAQFFFSAQLFSQPYFFLSSNFFRPILFQDIFFLSPCNSVKPAWVAREDWAAAGNEANKHENIIWTWREFILIVPISSLLSFSLFLQIDSSWNMILASICVTLINMGPINIGFRPLLTRPADK